MITNEGLSFDATPNEWLDFLLRKDSKFKDLATILLSTAPNSISVSGLSSSDYPLTDSSIGGTLDITNRTAFPFEVIERFSNIQYHCLSGVFDECSRIYVTIDNEIFIWNYSNEEDLLIYDKIQDPIIAIHFSKPKKDYFPSELSYMLILATTTEIFIFGIFYDEDDPSSFKFIDHILYRISTDEQIVSCISTTFDGRVILGTKEGNLLELNYKKLPDSFQDCLPDLLSFNINSSINLEVNNFGVGECTIFSWSSSSLSMVLPNILKMNFTSHDPITAIEIDNVRLIIYTLSIEGNITMYSFGDSNQSNRRPKGGIYSDFNTYNQSISKINTAKSSHLAGKAYTTVSSISRDQFKQIIKIMPLIGYGEELYLMALTSTGIRLYLDQNMNLKHVRLPPTIAKRSENSSETSQLDGIVLDNNDRIQVNFQHNQIKFCVESRGSLFMLGTNDVPINNSLNDSYLNQSSNYEMSNVYLISPDVFPWSSTLTETCTVLGSKQVIPNNVWGIFEINKTQYDPNDLLENHSDFRDTNMDSFFLDKNTQNTRSDSNKKTKSLAPVVLTQHLDNPSREFLLISPEGVIRFSLPSPLTRLHQFLSVYSNFGVNITDKESKFLPKYLQLLGPEESIAAALYVGGGANTVQDNRLEELAIETIHFFANSSGLLWSPSIKKPIDGSISDQKELNTINYELFLLTGVWLFIGRLLKPFWKVPLFNSIMTKDLSRIVGIPLESESTGNRSNWDPLSLVKRLAKTAMTKLAFNYKLNPEQNDDLISILLSPKDFFKGLSDNDILLMNSFTPDDYTFIRQYLLFASDFITYTFGIQSESCPPNNVNNNTGGTLMISPRKKEILRVSSFSKSIGIFANSTNKFISSCREILGLTATLSKYPVYRVSRLLNQDVIFTLSTTPFSLYIQQMFKISNSPKIPENSQQQQNHQRSSSNISIESLLDKLTNLMNAFIEFSVYTSSSEKGGVVSDNAILLETLSDELRNTCPTLFSDQDALCAKAAEYLQTANNILTTISGKFGWHHLFLENLRLLEIQTDPKVEQFLIDQSFLTQENVQLMLEGFNEVNYNTSSALKMYFDAVTSAKSLNARMTNFNLNDCITRLNGLAWSDAWRCGVRLARIYATQSDPTNTAVEFFRRGITSSNLESISFNKKCDDANFDYRVLERRMEAYKIILNVLDNLLEMSRLPMEVSDWKCEHLTFVDYKLEMNWSKNTVKSSLTTASTTFKGTTTTKAKHGYLSGQSSMNLKNSSKLNPFLARALLDRILKDLILQNELNEASDILSQYEAIGWLIQQGLEDKLMSLTSDDDKVLESYLHLRLNLDPTSVQLRELLNKVLIRKGAFAESARVLEHLATEPCSEDRQLHLQDRIENLSRAIISLKAVVSESVDLEYQNQLKERYDVALMQQNLFNELTEKEDTKANYDMKQRLNRGTLLTLTEQFTDVAVPYSLHKSRLCILQMSKYQDTELIKKFWDEFLAEILYAIRPRDVNTVNNSVSTMNNSSNIKAEDRFSRKTSSYLMPSSPTSMSIKLEADTTQMPSLPSEISQKSNRGDLPDAVNTGYIISQLAKISSMLLREKYSQERSNYLHSSSDNEYLHYFPIDLIVERLERFAASKSLHYTWLVSVFVKASLPIDLNLIRASISILYSVDKFWTSTQVRIHLLLTTLHAIKTNLDQNQRSSRHHHSDIRELIENEAKLSATIEDLKDKNSEIRQLSSEITNRMTVKSFS